MAHDPTARRLASQIAANTRWALEPDRAAGTAAARQAFNERFERLVDPDGQLTPEERARRAESARKAHFQRLALKSAAARRRKRTAAENAQLAEELRAAAAELDGGEVA